MAVIEKNSSSMGMPMNIERGNPVPLDSTDVWYSLSDAEAYAANGATAYVGQRLSVVDEENDTVAVYVIANTSGDLILLEGNSSSTSTISWGKLGIK